MGAPGFIVGHSDPLPPAQGGLGPTGFGERSPVAGTPPHPGIHPPWAQMPGGNRASSCLVGPGFSGQVNRVASGDSKQELPVADRDGIQPTICSHAFTMHQGARSAPSPQMTGVRGSAAVLLQGGDCDGRDGRATMTWTWPRRRSSPATALAICSSSAVQCRLPVATSSAASIELSCSLN
jgi:hypothetical protein